MVVVRGERKEMRNLVLDACFGYLATWLKLRKFVTRQRHVTSALQRNEIAGDGKMTRFCHVSVALCYKG